MVVLCFHDISSICWRIFAKLLSLPILGHRWPDYVFGSKGQSSTSHHRGGGAQHSTLLSSATFSSLEVGCNTKERIIWTDNMTKKKLPRKWMKEDNFWWLDMQFLNSGCCCCCCCQFSKASKIPKAFLIRSRVQRNFAYVFLLTLPTDVPSQIFHLFPN